MPQLDTHVGALLAEVDGKLHQVWTTKAQMMIILNMVAVWNDGSIPVREDPIEGAYLGGINARD